MQAPISHPFVPEGGLVADVDAHLQRRNWQVRRGAVKLLGAKAQIQLCAVTLEEGIDATPD